MPNHLAAESSPYLLQHAGNPVDWWPWCPEALAEARRTGRPVLLSIGYSSCHWCHVMAHESFEDPDTAALMNANFVNIKVDREERPDLDGIYMQAVQALTGSGGWPMTVFLTPDGVPFYGGTYFPPADRHGLPGFRRVLTSVAESWRTRRSTIDESAERVRAMYESISAPLAARAAEGDGAALRVDAAMLVRAYDDIARLRDPRFGGLGGAPKFPQPMALDFCLRHWARTGARPALAVVHEAFIAMARGGICDQVGGGFHRYSTDARWLVPHFEKMLYDNALLIRLGVHLWQATGDAVVRAATDDAIRWIAREMTSADGAFHSSLDADSEGEEGLFYTWTDAELRRVLGGDYDVCARAWGVTQNGNFEGRNILHAARSVAAGGADGADGALSRAKSVLLDQRSHRVRPARDEKVVVSWNGLMVRALAEAGRVLGNRDALAAAERAGEFLWNEVGSDGRAPRTALAGGKRVAGFLEDSASLGLAFVGLYQATFARKWLDRARALADACVRWFWSASDGLFYDTASDHETLIVRPRETADNATPAGTSLAIELELFMAEYFGDEGARDLAGRALDASAAEMAQEPVMMGHILGVADMAARGAVEIAIAGDSGHAGVRGLAEVVSRQYLPSLVLAVGHGEEIVGLPLFEGRAGATATAYVCRGYACSLPTGDVAVLASQLAEAGRAP
ncbi:MAG: thioredoxin domain-containing protein [Gemmatimonadaceae bacterium]|nr:thioredoxin domain-containing protein [Gemmatimonadaceae bacterium]